MSHVTDLLLLSSLTLPEPAAELSLACANMLGLLAEACSSPVAAAEPPAVTRARATLALLSHVDALIELAARRTGGRTAAWRAVAALEAARAGLRLWLVAQQHGGVLLRGGAAAPPAPRAQWWRGQLTGLAIPSPAEADAAPAPNDGGFGGAAAPFVRLASLVASAFSRDGNFDTGMPPTARGDDGDAVVARYPTATAACDGADCATVAAPLGALGETLHALRPLVTLGAAAALGPRSWVPWGLSLSMDLAADRCAVVAARRGAGERVAFVPAAVSEPLARAFAPLLLARRPPRGPEEGSVACEAATAADDVALAKALGGRDARAAAQLLRLCVALFSLPPACLPHVGAEVRRRRLLWALYLLRSPFVGLVTRPAVGAAAAAAARVPLLGALLAYAARAALGALDATQASYCLTSASQ